MTAEGGASRARAMRLGPARVRPLPEQVRAEPHPLVDLGGEPPARDPEGYTA